MIGNLIFILICVIITLIVLVIILHLKFNRQMRINRKILKDFNNINGVILRLQSRVSAAEEIVYELAETVNKNIEKKKKRSKK